MKNQGELIVVPDMSGSAPCGAVTWWRLSGTLGFVELSDAWAAAGLDESLLPSPPSEHVALRRALARYEGPHTDVVAMPKASGYAVVDTTFREDDDGKPAPVFAQRFKVWIDREHGVTVSKAREGNYGSLRAEIREALQVSQLELTAADIGSWLVVRVAAMNAIRLRDTGGIYFVPETHRAQWAKIADALQSVAQSRIWEIPALYTASAVEAVLEALREQATSELAKIEAALDRQDMGPRALKTKQSDVRGQLALLESYEALLGTTQQDLRDKIEAVNARIVEAALASEAAE